METQLQKRLITAAVLIVTLLAVGYFATLFPWGHFILLALGFLVLGLACGEYARLLEQDSEDFFTTVLTAATLLTPAVLQFIIGSDVLLRTASGSSSSEHIAFAASSAMMSFLVGVLLLAAHGIVRSRGRLDDMLSFLGARFAALFHVGAGGASALALLGLPAGVWVMFWLLLVVCVNDAAAYFVGRSFGKTSFAPVISPNKTWEGSLAGVLAGVLVGILFAGLLGLSWFSLPVLGISFIVIAFAQVGDLLKSLLKRRAGEKDSGSLLPGHGGVLDRVDATLLAALPLLFLLLWSSLRNW